jgi:hypothetical protein
MQRRGFFKLFLTLPAIIPVISSARDEQTIQADHRYTMEDCKLTLGKELPVGGFKINCGDYHWPFLRVGDQLNLIQDHDMPQDPNAVAVEIYDRIHIGYVPRPENKHIAWLLDQGIPLQCRIAKMTGTWRDEPGILFTVHRA